MGKHIYKIEEKVEKRSGTHAHQEDEKVKLVMQKCLGIFFKLLTSLFNFDLLLRLRYFWT